MFRGTFSVFCARLRYVAGGVGAGVGTAIS
jgi:hypothetical protein